MLFLGPASFSLLAVGNFWFVCGESLGMRLACIISSIWTEHSVTAVQQRTIQQEATTTYGTHIKYMYMQQ